MVKSRTVTVTATAPPPPKKPTAITITVTPTSGVVPFNVSVSGRLTDADTGAGVAGKPVRIYLNGTLHKTGYTEYPPIAGAYTIIVSITEVGTHSIYAEFLGDADYEGCEDRAHDAWGCDEEWR